MLNYRSLLVKYRNAKNVINTQRYLLTGRKPWTYGYWQYREEFLSNVLRDHRLLERFQQNRPLPQEYGIRLDERVIEYPWIISRLAANTTRLMDAGSTLNYPYILNLPKMQKKPIIIYTLAPEGVISRVNVSYIYGDLRRTILKDELFDEIVCISTLEHIGMDNTLIYIQNACYQETKPSDYRKVMKEFRRMLKPGGQLLLTVPYGQYQNHGWLQQFDSKLLEDAISAFSGELQNLAFYQYTPNGWVLSDADSCATCSYYNIHANPKYDADYAAAARAVACVQLIR